MEGFYGLLRGWAPEGIAQVHRMEGEEHAQVRIDLEVG
jgi:hypothetical protein